MYNDNIKYIKLAQDNNEEAMETLIKNNSLQPQEILGAVAKMDLVLSLNLLNDALEIYKTQQQQVTSVNNDEDPEAQEIQALIEERTTCKKAKNFERADEIRNQLKERGIVIEDTPNGPIWKRI